MKGKVKLRIKKFWNRLTNNLKNTDVTEYVQIGLKIAKYVKVIVESEVAERIVSITKTEVDNVLIVEINDIMDKVIRVLGKFECTQKETYQERLECFVNNLKKERGPRRNMEYIKIASMVVHLQSGVTEYEADAMVSAAYFIEKKNDNIIISISTETELVG